MIKSFVLTFVFWSLFTITNSIGDAIDFYKVFPWYGNMDLWHNLKYLWIGFAVLTGVFAMLLLVHVKYIVRYKTRISHALSMPYSYKVIELSKRTKYKLKGCLISGFLLLYFLFLRWIVFEALMGKWQQ